MSVVGRAYGRLPGELAGEVLASWLLCEFRRLRREEFDAFALRVQAVELGTARALARGFGGKVGPLPTWDDLEGEAQEEEPTWFQKFREANPKTPPVAD